MSFSPCGLLCLVVAGLSGALASGSWPIPYEAEQDTLPNLEVSLDPPAVPFPQVSAEIGNLEATRERLEAASMDRVFQAYRSALGDAKRRIGVVVGRAMRVFEDTALIGIPGGSQAAAQMSARWGANAHRDKDANSKGHGLSFLAAGRQQAPALNPSLSVRLNAVGSAAPAPELKHDIDRLEHHRFDAERGFFEQAIAEMSGLTDAVVGNLEVELQLQLDAAIGLSTHRGGASLLESALQELPQQVNVRVVPSSIPFPTVTSLVQDMETRRDLSESLVRARIAELLLQLLRDENAMVADALKAGVQRTLARYAAPLQSMRG